jgi:hypothetical protein
MEVGGVNEVRHAEWEPWALGSRSVFLTHSEMQGVIKTFSTSLAGW